MPEGSIIDQTRREAERFIVLEGFVPGDLDSATSFFERELPEAGFPLGEGDREEHEADTRFSGRGVTGRVRLRDILGCPGALTVAIAVTQS